MIRLCSNLCYNEVCYKGTAKYLFMVNIQKFGIPVTVLPAKSDSDVMFCLQLFSKTLTCTLHLS